jgi:hypothetical protein
MNLDNPNELAARIARAELAAIPKAVRPPMANDATALHHLPLQVRVGLTRRDDTGDLKDETRGQAKKPSPTQAPQAPSDGPPWTCWSALRRWSGLIVQAIDHPQSRQGAEEIVPVRGAALHGEVVGTEL